MSVIQPNVYCHRVVWLWGDVVTTIGEGTVDIDIVVDTRSACMHRAKGIDPDLDLNCTEQRALTLPLTSIAQSKGH